MDISNVKVMGELKDVLIHLPSNSKVHQMIDIIVVDILEAYGLILSKGWYAQLNSYFATYWSHLWLSYKDQPNKINVEGERYMKHMVTYINDTNEMVMFSKSILDKLFFDTLFGELEVDLSFFVDSNTQSELFHSTQIAELNCTLVDSSSTNLYIELTSPNLWTVYFDCSRNKDRANASCRLIDPHGNRSMLACHL